MTDLKPSGQSIRGYDCTSRTIVKFLTLPIQFGPTVAPIEFQLIDIAASFNLLLGRLWLHNIRGVSSSLHQCVKFRSEDEVIVIPSDLIVEGGKGDVPILEIQHGDMDSMMNGSLSREGFI